MNLTGLPRKTLTKDFLRGVLRPVYYRHEFARRNHDVVKASDEIMACFPITRQIHTESAGFMVPTDLTKPTKFVTFTHLLMKEYRLAAPSTRTKMRNKLSAFMAKHAVLPVSNSPTPFLPAFLRTRKKGKAKDNQWTSEEVAQSHILWQSLLKFERFMLVEGITNKPCFMPVVPVSLLKDDSDAPMYPHRMLANLYNAEQLVAIDTSCGLDRIKEHIETLLIHCDVYSRLQLKEEESEDQRRVMLNNFDDYLNAFDCRSTTLTKDSQLQSFKGQAVDHMAKHGAKTKRRHRGDKMTNAVLQSHASGKKAAEWLENGDYWIKHYKEIA